MCAMRLDRDPLLSDGQRAMYASAMSAMPPVTGLKCHACERKPEGNEDYPRCAKCRMMAYCSRECQKKDWPTHKLWCSQRPEPDKQRKFVLKCFGRIGLDLDFNLYLQMSIAEAFFDIFSQSSNADRKMWVFAVNIFLCPVKEEHIAALASPDIPLGALLRVPMVGKLMASKFVDISDQEQYPLHPSIRDNWQKLRDTADDGDMANVILTVVIFKYLGTQFFVAFNPVPCDVLVEINRKRELEKNETPGSVGHIDRWLQELKDSKGGKLVCPLGDKDKAFFRIGDLAAASPPPPL
ncbi:hypothetical protein GALMADRAFT_259874 [Galerina marginata CBS 339.88]|uniref:MYND-type domain-containing protein n=1 Tax=Galerina marginata (strain CBS 339.88) TaxID=685588 RepID=A0A067S5I0_GALM3|nr:hypothetical protein GALMADRAFT_259874 [Galerina marginata CBS 339.88]